ncbi:M56 family metallopeptidase [Parabacteroides pacaensis]|uniref:M56 family metallopeptidase n=1 Tax=Parabacteroides pacaensis TaxID=2086575 RepID=UPI000D0F3C74|nr:M56 family metallopeptidase [Parabacteroides pacaensis]
MTLEMAYFLKVNLAIALFYVFYRLFFYKDTFFRLRRSLLLAFFALAFLYPLLNIQEWIREQEPIAEVVTLYSAMLLEIPARIPQSTPTDWLQIFSSILLYGYFTGILALGIRFFIQFGSILILSTKCKKTEIKGTKIYVLDKCAGPFSFFYMIFVCPGNHTEKELEEILAHEKTHAGQYHSIDVIICEILSIICWFNPFVWLLKREVRYNLEYLADNVVIQSGYDSKSYQYHLLGLACHQGATDLYNSFNVLHLKNRISMMNKKRSPGIVRTKYLAFIPLAVLLMLMSNIEAVARVTKTIAKEIIAEKEMSLYREGKPGSAKTGKTPTNDDEVVVAYSLKHTGQQPEEKKGSVAGLQVEYDKQSSGSIEEKSAFTLVEEMPVYPGGEKAFMRAVNSRIRYPQIAYENGIEGRVVCSFVVNEVGDVNDIKVLRGVDDSLNKEAIRVISGLSGWTPGKQKGVAVKVKYTLPVLFRLNKEIAKHTGSTVSFLENKASLYLVDGKEMTYPDLISRYDVNSLVNVTVRKGNSVIQQYGEKAKNGVMIITTKEIN